MSKVCSLCGRHPSFGNNRSHSMVATRRRFDPNLQKMRILIDGVATARVRLHALPQGRQGLQGALGALGGLGVQLALDDERDHAERDDHDAVHERRRPEPERCAGEPRRDGRDAERRV